MAHDVFVSYSSQDKPTGDAIVASLEANGIRCWIAPRDILPGSDWSESIVDAIEQAGTMVLVFSSHSNTSPQIRREIERAVDTGIPVIPVRIEDVLPCRSLQYFIGPQHWLDAWTPPLEQHLHRLTDTIKTLLSKRLEGFDAAGREPRLKPQTDTAVGAPTPAAAEPPPTAAREETPVAIVPSPPRKFLLILLTSLVCLLVVLGVAGGIWWRWSQQVVLTSKVPAPLPATAPSTPAPPAKPAEQPKRGMIGLQVQNVTPELAKSFGLAEPKGALVAEVNPGYPAEKAGLQRGDIIIEFNGRPIQWMEELPLIVFRTLPGTEVGLRVFSDGKEKTLTLRVAELPKEHGAIPFMLLGLVVRNLDQTLAQRFRLQETRGLLVLHVEQGFAADKAGLRPGDLILDINGQAVEGKKDYQEIMRKLNKGGLLRLLIKRQGRSLYMTIEIPQA